MTRLDDDLRIALRAEADALRVPARPTLDRAVVDHQRRRRVRWPVAAACAALVVGGVVVLAQRGADDPQRIPSVASPEPGATTPQSTPSFTVPASDAVTPSPSTLPTPTVPVPSPVANGWVAFESTESGDAGIHLARPGEEARPLSLEGSEGADDSCPTWSPDGTRIMIGRLVGTSDSAPQAELVVVAVGADGTAGTSNVIALDGFQALDGFEPHPCAVWAADSRWVALAGTGAVWVVDTRNGEIRRLDGLRPSDLEWRPGTDELAIAGDVGQTRSAPTLSTPVTVYSVSTGEIRPLGAVEAAHLTWSPDGSTLALAGGEDGPRELTLIDADGSNPRVLVETMGENNHGIGPVWSPTGDRIAYQRLCCGRAETHEVVLVDVADGTETVLEPPSADGPGQEVRWYPYAVTWSPDGRTLLYAAWRSGSPPGEVDGRAHVVAVPVGTPGDVTVLGVGWLGDPYGHGWALPQAWGRAPDWSGPVRNPSDVVHILEFADDGRFWEDPLDASEGWVDIKRLRSANANEGYWSIELAAVAPQFDDLDPGVTVAYGLVFDVDADGVADYVVSIDNGASRRGDFHVSILDLGTGEADASDGPPYGYPVEFGYPSPQEPDYPLFLTFLGSSAPADLDPEAVRFYAWASTTRDGVVVAHDYAPDEGWVTAAAP